MNATISSVARILAITRTSRPSSSIVPRSIWRSWRFAQIHAGMPNGKHVKLISAKHSVASGLGLRSSTEPDAAGNAANAGIAGCGCHQICASSFDRDSSVMRRRIGLSPAQLRDMFAP